MNGPRRRLSRFDSGEKGWVFQQVIMGFETAGESSAMTEELVRQVIQMLGAVEGWRERPDWSGLVELQAIFQMRRNA